MRDMFTNGKIDVAAIAARLREATIPDADTLAALAERSWRITATRTQMSAIELGQSRFGGRPDVPADFLWPTRDGRPLSFLAQLDLVEIAAPALPSRGWLLFFYDVEEQPWGSKPEDAAGSRVVYVDVAREALVRRSHPTDEIDAEFQPCSLAFAEAIDLPDPYDSVVERAGVDIAYEQTEYYGAVLDELAGNETSSVDDYGVHHHLLGNPQLIQNDMRAECEQMAMASNPTTRSLPKARVKESMKRAPDEWQLLLQLDSDDDGPEWMWGDSGRIYFWIRRTDLAARAFDKTWLILQCY
ncbi:MAG: DUF1963 domain-containing protein [Myxococcales bacterium]|nr:DUF1963 domain-containing protein [Myxococcales bacterium]